MFEWSWHVILRDTCQKIRHKYFPCPWNKFSFSYWTAQIMCDWLLSVCLRASVLIFCLILWRHDHLYWVATGAFQFSLKLRSEVRQRSVIRGVVGTSVAPCVDTKSSQFHELPSSLDQIFHSTHWEHYRKPCETIGLPLEQWFSIQNEASFETSTS